MASKVQAKMAGVQTPPIAVGSGGTALQRKLAEHSKELAMMKAQTRADTAFDPTVPTRPTEAKFVENYCGCNNTYSSSRTFATLALLGVLYVIFSRAK